MKLHILIMGLIVSGVVFPVCAEQPTSGLKSQQETAQSSHLGTGKVIDIDRSNLNIKLAHEAIKSLGWPGMTMDFKVAKAAVLDGIKVGDAVNFELIKNIQTGKWLVIRISPRK
jgi:Cu/Ag efflux protein CusF